MDAFEALFMPEAVPAAGKKYFTVAEANRTLPLVRRIVTDVVRDYERLLALRDRCQDQDLKGSILEAESARRQYMAITDHLAELNEELEQIGCALKDYQIGLIDFPGLVEGREVCLCWRLGEPRVEFWHEIQTGFAGRRPIPVEMP